MTFFPMLVNTGFGLAAASHMERDLMRTYGRILVQTLVQAPLAGRLAFYFQRSQD